MNNKPIFCLLGQTGSGKSTILDILINKWKEIGIYESVKLKQLVYSTTRNKRPNEKDGVDYNFKTITQYIDEKENVVECRSYMTKDNNNSYYYTTKDEIENVEDCDALICAASVDQALSYMKAGYNVFFIIIYAPVKDRILRNLNRPGVTDNTCYEICRRILQEDEEFNNIFEFKNDKNSIIFLNSNDTNLTNLSNTELIKTANFIAKQIVLEKMTSVVEIEIEEIFKTT